MKKKLLIFLSLVVFVSLPLFITHASTFIPDEQNPNYEGELTKGTPVLEKGNLVDIVFRLIQYLLVPINFLYILWLNI